MFSRAARGLVVSALAGVWAGVCAAAAPAVEPGTRSDGTARLGLVELSGRPTEKPGPLDWIMGRGEPTLGDIVRSIDDAAGDESLRALFVRVKDAELSRTQIEEIGAALLRARGAGKKVHVFADAYGGPELLLASYADEVIAQAGGPVQLPGLYMEEMFLADTLAWAGVKADMVQIGDYKGASEQMARSAPSPQWEQNISQLLDSLYATMRQSLKKGRNLSDSQLDEAMEKAWLADAETAKAVGLVDTVLDLPSLNRHLEESYKSGVTWSENLVETQRGPGLDIMSNPFMFFQKLMSAKPMTKATGPTIAVLHIDGQIVDGDSGGGFFGGEGTVGSRTIRNAIEEIRGQSQIRGVVVRIDSPGGSATASEVIWRGLRRLAEKKPVWVSVGSMAASGGYYCAVAGDRLYVNPSSIVGSIGVVGGRVSLAGLYDKLKVGVVSRARGPRAGIFRSTDPWTPEELALVRAKMQETYDLFTRRVTDGRKGIDLSQTAEGRLFAGKTAVDLKMADRVGGLHETLDDLAAHVGLSGYEVMDFPGPKPLDEVIDDFLKGIKAPRSASADLANTARAVFGERNWPQIRGALEGLMGLRERPVMLMTPKVLMFN